ncbi:hypothetical protein TKK_0017381 [Trichogramma kaykai]
MTTTIGLSDALSGKKTPGGLYGVACLANKLVWALVLIKWLNFEVWWWLGDGSFAWHRCTSFGWVPGVAADG